MSEGLKPCPFCGSADIRNVSSTHPGPSYHFHAGDTIFAVNCGNCGASVPNRYQNEMVVSAWNKRYDSELADLRERCEAAEQLLVESRATFEMWKDVAPAVSLCADIDAFIAKEKQC